VALTPTLPSSTEQGLIPGEIVDVGLIADPAATMARMVPSRKWAGRCRLFGIDNSVPNMDLTPAEAMRRLDIRGDKKTVLFCSAIRPYNDLEYLFDAFFQLAAAHPEYRLFIDGGPMKHSAQYSDETQRTINLLFN
jgi:hypothetical protein